MQKFLGYFIGIGLSATFGFWVFDHISRLFGNQSPPADHISASRREYPGQIRINNGLELISTIMAENRVAELALDELCNPVQNAYIERLNRMHQEDVLDANLLLLKRFAILHNSGLMNFVPSDHMQPHRGCLEEQRIGFS